MNNMTKSELEKRLRLVQNWEIERFEYCEVCPVEMAEEAFYLRKGFSESPYGLNEKLLDLYLMITEWVPDMVPLMWDALIQNEDEKARCIEVYQLMMQFEEENLLDLISLKPVLKTKDSLIRREKSIFAEKRRSRRKFAADERALKIWRDESKSTKMLILPSQANRKPFKHNFSRAMSKSGRSDAGGLQELVRSALADELWFERELIIIM